MSFIEIDKQAYFYNLDLLSQKLGSKDRLSVVLKDNAYGHGLLEMAKLSCAYGIKRAIVRHLDEAKQIEQNFDHIIILSPTQEVEENQKFSYVINELSQIKNFPQNSSVHLKVDTGMHRNGISIDEIKEALKEIDKQQINLDGVMTHFRSADELSSELFWQQKVWSDVKKEIKTLTKTTPLFHSANSATVLRLEVYEDDFARCGIATYGYSEMDQVFEKMELKPVLSLWAEKISTRILKEGQRVGYGGQFEANEDMLVSAYDIGYGDGFFRYLNSSQFLGKVSMDSCMIKGDVEKICLIGDASKIAKDFSTISYDVLTKLSPFIKRVIIH